MKSSHGLFLCQEFLVIFFNRRSGGLSTLIADLAVFFFPKTDLKIFFEKKFGRPFSYTRPRGLLKYRGILLIEEHIQEGFLFLQQTQMSSSQSRPREFHRIQVLKAIFTYHITYFSIIKQRGILITNFDLFCLQETVLFSETELEEFFALMF